MPEQRSHTTATAWPAVYEIRIEGHLARAWTGWFAGMSMALEERGHTLLTGEIVDPPALYALLKKVRDLGAPLVSVHRLDPDRHRNQQ